MKQSVCSFQKDYSNLQEATGSDLLKFILFLKISDLVQDDNVLN